MSINPQNIKYALAKTLPGETSHQKMLPLNRRLDVGENEKGKIKHSSVLLLVFSEKEELHVLLIKRPQHMKHHAGQIALPGGRIEKGETALETAMRETEEEIGVIPDQYEILGSLSPLYVQVSRFQIHPFVAWLDKKPELKLNPNEVEKTLSFPLKRIKDTFSEAEIPTITGPLNVPCFFYKDEIIWGATSMILSEFADALEL
jgi:8-oxo-dGTP pyrophosphatase MutT (NUDIX family)